MKNIRNCEIIKSYLPTSVAEPVGADYALPRDGDEILTRLRLYVNKKFTVENEPKYLPKLKSYKIFTFLIKKKNSFNKASNTKWRKDH